MKERILVLNKFCPLHPAAGGAEKNLFEMFSRLGDHYEVFLLAAMFPGAKRSERLGNIHIMRLGNPRSENIVRIHLLIPLLIGYYVRKLKPDILFEDVSVLPFFSPLLARRTKNITMVHGFNRHYLLSSGRFVFGIIAWIAERLFLLLYRKQTVIAVSEWMAEELRKAHFKDIHVIPNGVNESLFASPKHYAPEPTVLFLGRLEERKGIDLLLATYERVKQSVPHVRYLIAGRDFSFGNGRLKRIVDRYRTQYAENEISFLGFVSDEKKHALLGSAWVFAMPSRTEGYGIAAIEANAAGTFVIGNDVEGLREAIRPGESGVLVDCSDPELFSRILIEWLNRARLEGKEKTARAWAKLHSWDASAEMLRALLTRSEDRRA